jgi:hypothetical protein
MKSLNSHSRETAEGVLRTELGCAVEAHDRATLESLRLSSPQNGADAQELSAAAARQTLTKEAMTMALRRFNRLRSGLSVPGLKTN